MRSTLLILICCLYALSAVDANPFSKSGGAEVQQGNTKAAKPLNHWSDDKSYDDDKDDKWTKDDDDDHYGGKGQDECASRSVSVLIGTSTYVIPCLQGDSIVNLNGLVPTSISSIASSSATGTSSFAASSSAASSSEASSATDSTTTTTDSTTTTTDTTTSADSSPTFTVTLFSAVDCSGNAITSSNNYGCFNYNFTAYNFVAVESTLTTQLVMDFYQDASCTGIPYYESGIAGDSFCNRVPDALLTPILSYSVMPS